MALQLALLVASGVPYFAGLTVIASAVLVPAGCGRWVRIARVTLYSAGALLIVASATPIPLSAYVVVVMTGAVAGIVRFRVPLRRPTAGVFAKWSIVAACAAAGALEARYWLMPCVPISRDGSLCIVGDSLSAGLGTGVAAWPQQLAHRRGYSLRNLAAAGATTTDARKQADALPQDAAVVFVLIGGNDLLGNRPVSEFERDLDYVLERARALGCPVVMQELPLPPLGNHYGAAQRALAKKHGATLVPKWCLAWVLVEEGATVDGLHLSERGHRSLARSFEYVLGQPAPAPTSRGA